MQSLYNRKASGQTILLGVVVLSIFVAITVGAVVFISQVGALNYNLDKMSFIAGQTAAFLKNANAANSANSTITPASTSSGPTSCVPDPPVDIGGVVYDDTTCTTQNFASFGFGSSSFTYLVSTTTQVEVCAPINGTCAWNPATTTPVTVVNPLPPAISTDTTAFAISLANIMAPNLTKISASDTTITANNGTSQDQDSLTATLPTLPFAPGLGPKLTATGQSFSGSWPNDFNNYNAVLVMQYDSSGNGTPFVLFVPCFLGLNNSQVPQGFPFSIPGNGLATVWGIAGAGTSPCSSQPFGPFGVIGAPP